MGTISRTADLFYTFRFLDLLVTQWKNTDAYKLGIVDDEGNLLKKASELKTDEEKSAYTPFHRLVYNIKRLLNKLPGGKTRIASYAAALYLIKEEVGFSEESIRKILDDVMKVDCSQSVKLTENYWFLNADGQLNPGKYTLTTDCILQETLEARARSGSTVVLDECVDPIGYFMGHPVFLVPHSQTGKNIYISLEDIKR
jgi:hypothetical protein